MYAWLLPGTWYCHVLALLISIAHFLEILQPVVTKQATKSVSCTAVPARKGTAPNEMWYDTPSRVICNEIIPGMYPWYTRTPEKED